MIRVQGKIERNPIVAFSGGVDSVAVLDFLSNNHRCDIAWMDHGDEAAKFERELVYYYADKYDCAIFSKKLVPDVSKPSKGKEADWSAARYEFFHSLPRQVITCHHLDDCVETWVWFMCQGKSQTIGYRNQNVVRPFRLTKKSALVDLCKRKGLRWYEDPTNLDTNFARRNYIRHVLLPQMLHINPGLMKTVYKKIQAQQIQ